MAEAANFIGGEWISGLGEPLISINPATEEEIWQKNKSNPDQVAKAIAAAEKALPAWSKLDIEKRFSYLEKYIEVLKARKEEMTEAIVLETGKPYWEATTEVNAMISKLDISWNAIQERCPLKEQQQAGTKYLTRHKAHGILAVIGPFNFPGHLPNGHVVPALLAGNVIVFKPSEHTPMVAEKMLSCWQQADLPPGVINLVQGGSEVGSALIDNPKLAGVLFTGSYNTGQLVAKTQVKYPSRIIALEMGGNNPLIVSEISNVQAAVYTTIQSAFITSGQRCTCARRLIVVNDAIGQEFISQLAAVTENIKVAAPAKTDDQPFMGSLISVNATNSVMDEYHRLIDNGADVLVPLKRAAVKGAFLRPSIIDVTKVSNRDDKEIFGPLLQLIVVDDFASAIKEANNTSYGLSAGLLSDNPSFYEEFFANVRAGIINWNKPITGASSSSPFGGVGLSGNHRPSAYYAADYCSYPVASVEETQLNLPKQLTPGINLESKAA